MNRNLSLTVAGALLLGLCLVAGCTGGTSCCGTTQGGGAAQAPAAAAPAAAAAETSATPQQRKPFFCPMHPEVTSDQAGKCPICAMPLSKRAER